MSRGRPNRVMAYRQNILPQSSITDPGNPANQQTELLTADAVNLEAANGWTPITNATLTRVNVGQRNGQWALQIAPTTGTGTVKWITTAFSPVTGANTYTGLAWVKTDVGTAQAAIRIWIDFYDNTNTFAGSGPTTTFTAPAGSYVQATTVAAAPANAVTGRLVLDWVPTASTNELLLDDASLKQGGTVAPPGGTTDPPPGGDPTPNPPPSGTGSHTGLWSATSLWNSRIATGASYATTGTLTDSSGKGWINIEDSAMAIYYAKSTDPFTRVTIPQGNNGGGSYSIQMPANANGAPPVDNNHDHYCVIVGTDGYVHSIWMATRTSSTTMSGNAYAKCPTNGTGFGYIDSSGTHKAGQSAIGCSNAGGIIMASDMSAGVIDHALFNILGNQSLKSGFVSPAVSQDSQLANSATGTVPEGARLAIPRTVAVPSGWTGFARMMWICMQEYGTFVGDRSQTFGLFVDYISITVGNPTYANQVAAFRADSAKYTLLIQNLRRCTNY
jgi:hypothetical protein